MNLEKIWRHIGDNSPFYIHLSIQADMELDIERRVSKASKDFEYWDADPMSFISTAFRSIRAKGEEDLSLGEAPYIVAYLNKKNIAPPFTKREYNEYVMDLSRNNQLLLSFESGMFYGDRKFIIPNLEDATRESWVSFEHMRANASDLFLYQGMEASCHIDIYDFISGFSVATPKGEVFIPMGDNPTSSAFFMPGIRMLRKEDTITVVMGKSEKFKDRHDVVTLSDGDFKSIASVSRYFTYFDIQTKSIEDAVAIAKEIFQDNIDAQILYKESCSIGSAIASHIELLASEEKAKVYDLLTGIMHNLSYFSDSEKKHIIMCLEESEFSPYLTGVIKRISQIPDLVSPRIRDIVLNTSLDFLSKNVVSSGDSGAIKVFNNVGKYFKTIPMESRAMIRAILPELGGMRSIANRSNTRDSDLKGNHKTVDAMLTASIIEIVQDKYSSLPVYERTLGLGMYKLDGKPVFNTGTEIYGITKNRSIGGTLFEYHDSGYEIPVTKPTRKGMAYILTAIEENVAPFVHNPSLFAVALTSTLITPFMETSRECFINISGASPYREANIKKALFTEMFKASMVLHNITGAKLGSNSLLAVYGDSKENRKETDRMISERRVSSSLFGEEILPDSINYPSVVMISEEEVEYKDFMFLHFRSKNRMMHSRKDMTEDISTAIISYVSQSAAPLARLESKAIEIRDEVLEKIPMASADLYMDFFSRIVAGMTLVEHTGYSTMREYHDTAYAEFFKRKEKTSLIDIKSMLLSLPLTDGNGLKKVNSPLYRLDHADDELVFVDKVFHVRYADKENTRMHVFIFNKMILHDKIKGTYDISYESFSDEVDKCSGSISHSTASSNYRIGRDRGRSVLAKYRDIHGKNRDFFAAIRIDEERDL